MRAKSSTGSKGLERKSSAPASRPAARRSGVSLPVIMSTGTCRVRALAFTLAHTARPPRSGMNQSTRITSGTASARRSSASAPPWAVTTSYSLRSSSESVITIECESSTTSTRGRGARVLRSGGIEARLRAGTRQGCVLIRSGFTPRNMSVR